MHALSFETLMPDPVIAFVNDNEKLIHQAQLALVPEGFRVIAWHVEQGALEMILEQKPDLVVLDFWLNYDQGAGARVVRALRDEPGTASIPVIFTSDDKARLGEEVSQLGDTSNVATLVKPYDWDDLLALIRRMLSKPTPA